MTNPMLDSIPVVIVTFRNAEDANGCLHALRRMDPKPGLEVFICENGGSGAFDHLVETLTGPQGPCQPDYLPPYPASPRLVRIVRLRLQRNDPSIQIAVHVGEAVENLGYAGGINAWIEPLLTIPGWPGAWILNPDTEPAPSALSELVGYAARYGRGMTGSRFSRRSEPEIVHSRGLAWRKWRAATISVDLRAPANVCPPPDETDRRLDSPSGASIYVTRDCIERIGLMDERYFLYFEDLEWGFRAKTYTGVGYAHRSVVAHEGGTTIGSSNGTKRNRSPLAVYLDFRNRIIFVRSHFPTWLPWTFLIEFGEIIEYGRLRAFRNMLAALRGMADGLAGQAGRPDHILRAYHTAGHIGTG